MVAPSSCCSAQSWPERVRWQYSVAASMTNMSSSSARSQVFQRVMPSGFWKNFFERSAMRARHIGIDRRHFCAWILRIARPDAPALALHLVLARLDDEAQQIVGVGKAAQLGKADRLVGARPGDEVIAGRKIETPARRPPAARSGAADRAGRTSRRPLPRAMPCSRRCSPAAVTAIGAGRHSDLIRRQRPSSAGRRRAFVRSSWSRLSDRCRG